MRSRFGLHHANKLNTRRIDHAILAAFKQSQHLLTRKLRVDRKFSIGEIDDRVRASSAFARRSLQRPHVRRQEI